MKHSVNFRNCPITWDNALPIGNGNFGAMLYFDEDKLYMPMNHYEVYYTSSDKPFPNDRLENMPLLDNPGELHRSFKERADRNQPPEGEPFISYRTDRALLNKKKDQYGAGKWYGVHPATGDFIFYPSPVLKGGDHTLTLYAENACVTMNMAKGDASLRFETIASREDFIINKVTQSESGLLSGFDLSMEPYRDLDAPDVKFTQIDEHTFRYTVTRVFENPEKPFVFSGIIRLCGAKGILSADDYVGHITITESEPVFHIVTGIFTQYRYNNPSNAGIEQIEKAVNTLDEHYAQHQQYWKDFFSASSISIPDKFLETVYYINQYTMDCCSGKNGIMKHQACGLNGLWDVRHPIIWQSCWYWDVNIQAAFAGVFSSNRLDLGKVFSDGLLSYVEVAERFARNVHNMPGVAFDYTPQNYYSTWPWCAQYLWSQYEYSGDVEYLRNDAYPLFKKLCQFALALFEYDPETDTYFVYPDISPEQGPLAHNTTITIASVKYLLKFTLKAAQILHDDDPMLDGVRVLLEKMPPYYFSEPGKYGVHLKDSMEAPDNMWLRHPSLLMPLFPTGEFDPLSMDAETYQKLSNTVDFMDENCEIGIFGGTWIAAAAARLGRGQAALRLIYERGIDHVLRPNGLSAEETERFMNHCLLVRQPLYYPCMVEFTGQMLAAVNEMLLQSYNDVIRVFPALPDGDKEYERFLRSGYGITEYDYRCVEYPAWNDLSFDKLLARGAFEISAKLENRKLQFIKVHSKRGGIVRITSPFLSEGTPVFHNGKVIDTKWENGILIFNTEVGGIYLITADSCIDTTAVCPGAYNKDILCHKAYTMRRVYIGEDPDAQYYKALDGFMFDWYLGNVRMENHTLYKFDFGINDNKDYLSHLPEQMMTAEPRLTTVNGIIFLTPEKSRFTVKEGFGLICDGEITGKERKSGDLLRKDFIEGTEPAEFIIDAPRSQYEFFIVSGDSEEDSVTIIETENGFRTGGDIVKKGSWQYELVPVIQKKDHPVRLKISTKPGYKWKLNILFMNTIKGY